MNERHNLDEDDPSSPSTSTASSAVWLGNVTLGWQEKLFSLDEENYYRGAKEEDFQVGTVFDSVR